MPQVPAGDRQTASIRRAPLDLQRARTPDATHCAWQPWVGLQLSTSAGATEGPIRSSSVAASSAAGRSADSISTTRSWTRGGVGRGRHLRRRGRRAEAHRGHAGGEVAHARSLARPGPRVAQETRRSNGRTVAAPASGGSPMPGRRRRRRRLAAPPAVSIAPASMRATTLASPCSAGTSKSVPACRHSSATASVDGPGARDRRGPWSSRRRRRRRGRCGRGSGSRRRTGRADSLRRRAARGGARRSARAARGSRSAGGSARRAAVCRLMASNSSSLSVGRLGQDGVADADLADVVQQRARGAARRDRPGPAPWRGPIATDSRLTRSEWPAV